MNKTNHANANTNANKKMTLPFAERQTIAVRNHMMSLETISFYDFDSPYEYLENCYWEKTDHANTKTTKQSTTKGVLVACLFFQNDI